MTVCGNHLGRHALLAILVLPGFSSVEVGAKVLADPRGLSKGSAERGHERRQDP